MGPSENKRMVQTFIDRFSAGDYTAALDCFWDDATWWVAGDTAFSGTSTKQQLLGAIGPWREMFEKPLSLKALAMTAEGDRVAVEAESYGRLKNGKIFNNLYHMLFVLKDGKIQSFKEYMDTKHLHEVLCT